jgi:hypothetical protein
MTASSVLKAKQLPDWTKLPTEWIEQRGLKEFRWAGGNGSDNQAALMVLTVIVNHAELESGVARLTYDELCEMSSLSRAKVARALEVLSLHRLVARAPDGRSSYRVTNHDAQTGWAKFPARGLYLRGAVAAFMNFRLRQRSELDALKLYFLFASRRDRRTNMAKISYDKIEEYTGVSREHIKRGLTVLGANSLVHIEHVPSAINSEGVASAYRLVHLKPRQHMGTWGRGADAMDFSG